MTIIDTSSWIEMLRTSGEAAVRDRVIALMAAGQARLIAPVRLELWHRARGKKEQHGLRTLEDAVPELPITPEVWDEALQVARQARAAGLTCPTIDILIHACARHFNADIESVDRHFDDLRQLSPNRDRSRRDV